MALRWRPARIVDHREVARGSRWLTLEAADGEPAEYEPGHVISLALRDGARKHEHHAYTISCADPERGRFEHLYRVIPDGWLTPKLAERAPGEIMYFRGKAHTPIQQEVRDAAARVVGIATGTGIGPLYGYARKTLAEGEARPVTVYCGMRNDADMCLTEELDDLRARYPNFDYAVTLTEPGSQWTGLTGRVTESVPPLLRDIYRTHFHLVGNGAMIEVVRHGFRAAGVKKNAITVEYYFNFKAEAADDDIDAFVEALGDSVESDRAAASG